MKWFGEPWPDAQFRASVCEDDKERVPLPDGERCAMCGNPLEPDAQGVVIPHMDADRASPWLSWIELRYIHIDCMMRSILGE